jgi:isopentenyl diphosphate isomerase/L-lactate dehydrogenase-like FMN-dependent dehydrogenase
MKLNTLNLWQKTVNSTVDILRPGLKKVKHLVQPGLDMPFLHKVKNAINVNDLRKVAEKRAHPMVFAYLDGGSDDEIALKRSTQSFQSIELKHAVLHGVSKETMDLSTTIMGINSSLPILLTSCAGQKMFHAQGEIATAKAARKHNIPMTLSQLTTTDFREVTNIAPDQCKALQLYVWKDKELLTSVLQRARECGFTSLVLTADFSWVGNREKEKRSGFSLPPDYSFKQCCGAFISPAWTYDYMSEPQYGYKAVPNANFPAASLVDFINSQMKPEFNWKDAEWLNSTWKSMGGTHCVLKGVACEQDALHCLDTGFDTIWVSNHGGRQLDCSIPTIETLPKIRDKIGSETEIILDGGIRRGLDVIKGILLGADSVAIGRPYLYGLTAGGFEGVDKCINILKDDLILNTGLLGCNNVKELKQNASKILVDC